MKPFANDNEFPHLVDKMFHDRVEAYEEMPGELIWNKLDKELDRYSIQQTRRKYTMLQWVAAALLILLASTLFYEIMMQGRLVHAPVLAGSIFAAKPNGVNSNPHANASITGMGLTSTASGTASSAARSIHSAPIGGDKNTGIVEKSATPTLTRDLMPIHEILESKDPLAAVLLTAAHTPQIVVQGLKAGITVDGKEQAGSNADIAARNLLKVTPPRARRFSLAAYFSPNFVSNHLTVDNPTNREDSKTEIKRSEQYAVSSSFGIRGEYRIGKNWSLESGIDYSRVLLKIDPKIIFARRDEMGDVKFRFPLSSGYSFISPKTVTPPAFGDSLAVFHSTNSLHYISIPLTAKYTITHKRWSAHAMLGVAANLLEKQRMQTTILKGATTESTSNRQVRGLKPMYMSAVGGMGVSYQITRAVAVNLHPEMRIGVNAINREAPVKSYLQSFTLGTGVQISF